MLSQTCKTAVKAVLFLALKLENGEKAGIKEIADYLNASEHTVGKMLQTLVRRGVINSLKGPSGGFYISKLQQEQPIINIVEAIDGENVFGGCGLGLSRCSTTHPCPIHNEYKEARDVMNKIFRNKSVADLCAPVHTGLAYLAG